MEPVNTADLEWEELSDGQMNTRRKQLGAAAGGEQLGCSLYELPPGEQAWPYHYHAANEEALYVLAGTGRLRCETDSYTLRDGDYVAFPTGEAGGHKVINDSETTLRYLMISTMTEPDVTVYPDSNKLGVYVGSAPGGERDRSVEGYYQIDSDVDYWDGE